MQIGYARISTNEQDAAAQVAALRTAGCELIFKEKASCGRWERPELHRLLGQLRRGDVVVVWKLDRLSRSLKDVLTTYGDRGAVATAQLKAQALSVFSVPFLPKPHGEKAAQSKAQGSHRTYPFDR
jgi:Resolvase, N terminal domain